jgi:SAM-dependent methyltransferase
MKTLYSSTENLTAVNEFHSGYYGYGDPDVPSRTVKDYERALGILAKNIPGESRSIFDVGCGNGLFLALAKRNGWKVHGCDSSRNNVDFAATKFGLHVRCSDFSEFDSQGERYDAVSFWDVLEHFSNPHQLIQKTSAMLKPEGAVIVGGPCDGSLLRFLAEWIYALSFGKIKAPLKKVYLLEHVSYFNRKSMELLWAEHGFVLVDCLPASTDLDKYRFSPLEKAIAWCILTLGKILRRQNRFICVFRRKNDGV